VTVILRASSLPGCTEWLAGVSPTNKVNWSNIFATQLPHIFELGNIRPMFTQYSTTERVDFAEGDGGHTGPLQADVHAAYSRKKGQHPHFPSPPSFGGGGKGIQWVGV